MKPAFVALVLLVSAGGLVVPVACGQPSEFKITMKRKDDAVEVRAGRDRTVFSVKSPFGISQAVLYST